MAQLFEEKADSPLYELFHENSKLSRYDSVLSDTEVQGIMRRLEESLSYPARPSVALPTELTPISLTLGDAIEQRRSVLTFTSGRLSLCDVATLLHCGCGVTSYSRNTADTRGTRAAPSAGALYPLEIYVHSSVVEGLAPGLHHYNPVRHELRRLRGEDLTAKIAESIVYEETARTASLQLFITAIFPRTWFKYGERGYRFALLEAGHVAQNVSLVAAAMGLGSVTLGGYYDREIDELLQLDGVTQSTIYMMAVGTQD